MPLHDDKEILKVAKVMAKDFLEIQRSCTYKELNDVERDNLERIAMLARQVIDDPNEYIKEDEDQSFGC